MFAANPGRRASHIHNYAGNPAIYPANIGLVDDADLNPATASALDVAPTNLADRTAWLHANAILVTGGVITGDLEFAPGSFLTVDAGASEQLFGLLEVETGGAIQFDTGTQLNGTAGGTFALSGVVSIASGGLLEVQSGAALTIDAGASFVIPAFPDFITPTVDARVRSWREASVAQGLWTYSESGIKDESVSPPLTTSAWVMLGLPTHNGARLDSITVTFEVGQDHAGKPDASGGHFPKFFVKRQAHAGAALDSLIAAGSVEIPTGSYADGHAWYAGGAPQTFTVTINQNNTIDTSAYAYHIMVQDEIGVNALSLNKYTTIRCNYSNINSSQWA